MTLRVFEPKPNFPQGLVETPAFHQQFRQSTMRSTWRPGNSVPKLKRELNAFLATWLRNLIAQGHVLYG